MQQERPQDITHSLAHDMTLMSNIDYKKYYVSQTWRRRTEQKSEEVQLKQLRAAMTQLELPDTLEYVDR